VKSREHKQMKKKMLKKKKRLQLLLYKEKQVSRILSNQEAWSRRSDMKSYFLSIITYILFYA